MPFTVFMHPSPFSSIFIYTVDNPIKDRGASPPCHSFVSPLRRTAPLPLSDREFSFSQLSPVLCFWMSHAQRLHVSAFSTIFCDRPPPPLPIEGETERCLPRVVFAAVFLHICAFFCFDPSPNPLCHPSFFTSASRS